MRCCHPDDRKDLAVSLAKSRRETHHYVQDDRELHVNCHTITISFADLLTQNKRGQPMAALAMFIKSGEDYFTSFFLPSMM